MCQRLWSQDVVSSFPRELTRTDSIPAVRRKASWQNVACADMCQPRRIKAVLNNILNRFMDILINTSFNNFRYYRPQRYRSIVRYFRSITILKKTGIIFTFFHRLGKADEAKLRLKIKKLMMVLALLHTL